MILGVGECKKGQRHLYRWRGMDTVECMECGQTFHGHTRDLGTHFCKKCGWNHPN